MTANLLQVADHPRTGLEPVQDANLLDRSRRSCNPFNGSGCSVVQVRGSDSPVWLYLLRNGVLCRYELLSHKWTTPQIAYDAKEGQRRPKKGLWSLGTIYVGDRQ